MRLILLAPGEADDEKERAKWSFYTAKMDVHYVGRAFPGSAIYFPHVDSCIALVFKLKGGSVVGGHAGVFYFYKNKSLDPGLPSLIKVLKDMKAECAGQAISEVYAIGNTKDWEGNVELEIKKQCPGSAVTVKDKTPVNIVVDIGVTSSKILVYDWVKNEDSAKWMYGSKNPANTFTM